MIASTKKGYKICTDILVHPYLDLAFLLLFLGVREQIPGGRRALSDPLDLLPACFVVASASKGLYWSAEGLCLSLIISGPGEMGGLEDLIYLCGLGTYIHTRPVSIATYVVIKAPILRRDSYRISPSCVYTVLLGLAMGFKSMVVDPGRSLKWPCRAPAPFWSGAAG